jgi:F-type H+-transporting ATPase subunit epsilon
MDTIKLEIVSPEGPVFKGEVVSITLPGSEGEFGVLPGHASLLTLLKAGIIDIQKSDNNHEIVAINWGYAEVDETKVTILADGAVYVGGESESEIEISIKKAKELLESISSDSIAIASVVAKVENVAKRKF